MNRQINYKTMRIVVGLIAILLAPTVWWLSGPEFVLTSISISYWTGSGAIFVGSLAAVGFFLFAYNGSGETKDWEFYLSKIAFVSAIIVALFPTTGFSLSDVPPVWTNTFAKTFGLEPVNIHTIAAILLFASLIAMMWFFSIRARDKGKFHRTNIYRSISILMIGGPIFVYFYNKYIGLDNALLIIEIWELTLFGLGWLIAGAYKTEPNLN